MRTVIVVALALLVSVAGSAASAQGDQAQPAIALVGGHVDRCLQLGESGHDIQNAVVVVRDGRIGAAGLARLVKVPKDATAIDYTGSWF